MRFAVAWLLLCSVSLGQIKLVESKTETWAGLKNAVLNDDGTITTGPDSKPILTAKSVRFSFETAVAYKFKQLKAKRLSTGEKVSMEQEKDKETYWFRAGAPEGKYELEYTVFDPEKGIDSDEWIIDYKPIVAPVPGPVDPIKPDDVIPTDEVERIVFNAMLEMRKGYGSAFRSAAAAIERREITVDAKLYSYLEPLTRNARTNAMAGIDGLIQTKLPRDVDKLKPEAAKFIESIGLAFEKGTK
jgi:hypothetical protein